MPSNKTRNPLLPEVDSYPGYPRFMATFVRRIIPINDHGDLNGVMLAMLFAVGALFTTVLSILAGAGLIWVDLTPEKPSSNIVLSFGYVYEMNGAFFYCLLAPLFMLFSSRFLSSTHTALRELVKEERLVSRTGEPSLEIFRTPLLAWVWALLLVAGIIVGTWIVYGTELKPPPESKPPGIELKTSIGNYYRLAFGYVQAPFIPDYKNSKLNNLPDQRVVYDLPHINREDFGSWTVSAVKTVGPLKEFRKAFYIFLAAALLLQILFIPLAIWLVLKGVYLFYFVYRAASPIGHYRARLKLNPSDEENRFGLKLLSRAYNDIAVLVGLGAFGALLASASNLAKGSRPLLDGSGALNYFSSLAQNLISILPLVLGLSAATFVVAFHFRAEAFRDIKIRRNKGRGKKGRDKTRKICEQSTWPDLPVLGLIGFSGLILFVPPAFFVANPEHAELIHGIWVAFVDSVRLVGTRGAGV